MLAALHAQPKLQPLLPYARQFYATASRYVWTDDQGCSHEVCQTEGGEQSDPLMPGLYSLVAHGALQAVQSQLRDGEAVFAFLDDIYVVAAPERGLQLHEHVEVALWEHARVRLNRSKTKAWNAAGEEPQGIRDLQPEGDDPV